MVDTQFADSLPDGFRIARKTKGETIQSGRDQDTRSLVLEPGSPLPEFFCLLGLDHLSELKFIDYFCQ